MKLLNFNEFMVEGYKEDISKIKMKKEYLKKQKEKLTSSGITPEQFEKSSDIFWSKIHFTPPEFRSYLEKIGFSIVVTNGVGLVDEDSEKAIGLIGEGFLYSPEGVISKLAKGEINIVEAQKEVYSVIRPVLAKLVKSKVTSIEDIEKASKNLGIKTFSIDY